MPYVEIGSVGVGLVLREFLRLRADERFHHAEQRILNTCRIRSGIVPGLFTGHAGLLTYLATSPTDEHEAIRWHLHRMSWFTERRRAGIAFLGDQLHRLSMDLATGSAGILLALATVFNRTTHSLPFLDPVPATPQPRTLTHAERR